MDFSAHTGLCLGAQVAAGRQLGHIQNLSALGTEEMHMGLRVSVEPLHAIQGTNADDFSLLLEQGKIPINRAQREVGILRLQPGIHHLRRGVFLGLPQVGQDCVALPELLLASHKPAPFAHSFTGL